MGCIVPGASQVPGEPQLSVCTCSNPTPAGLHAPDRSFYSAAAWPLVQQKQRLPRKVSRSSIAWLSDSLSTLRRTGCPDTTQDSLPAAGQALPDGLSTRKVPTKGFRFASYISSPFPKLLGAISSDREQFARLRAAERCRHSDCEEWWSFSPDHGCRS